MSGCTCARLCSASSRREFATEFSPLGINLVSASTVFWATAQSRLVEQLPAERYSMFMETYYEKIWEGIVSRFGTQKAQYDEFTRHVGGFVLPDEIKTDWACRVHDVLGVAVKLICPAADGFFTASDSDRSAWALGEAVGQILFGGQADLDIARIMIAFTRFTALAFPTIKFLRELEKDGFQVY